MPNHFPRIIQRREPAYQISRDCDCACSDAVALQKNDIAVLFNKNLQTSPDLGTFRLREDYRVAFVASGDGVSDSIAVFNNPVEVILSTFKPPSRWGDHLSTWYQQWGKQTVNDILTDLTQLRFVVNPDEKLIPAVEQPHTLAAWLHITDRCNLRCTYCYLPHDRVDMSIETGIAAIEATFRSAVTHGYQEVKLKYAGGEPLLRFPLITTLHQHAQTLADKHGLSLDGVILSNGTLLKPETLQKMKSLALRLMLSLDGLNTFHDSQRPFADGHGSVEYVTHAVKLAIAYGIVPDISVTVTSHNVRGIPQVVAWILEHDLPFSLNFYRDNELSVSQANLQLQEEQIIEGMLAAYKVIESNLPRQSLLASLADRANLAIPHMRTCGVGHSYLVFDYQGGVNKCQMQIGNSVTNVYDHDPLRSIRLDLKGIINLPVDEKEGCRDCEWKYWCAGGCPLHTYRATGRYDVKSPNCNIYKALYPEIIRLEGLRLLKYADHR